MGTGSVQLDNRYRRLQIRNRWEEAVVTHGADKRMHSESENFNNVFIINSVRTRLNILGRECEFDITLTIVWQSRLFKLD